MEPGQDAALTASKEAGQRSSVQLTEAVWVGVLVLTAGGAVRVGMIPGMAPAANVVFGLAGVVLVAYVGSRLGVLAEAARLLTAWRSSERRGGTGGAGT